MLLLGAALAIIGAALPAIVAGFGLLEAILTPVLGLFAGMSAGVLALVAVLALAVVDIIEHWDEFAGYFEEMWSGVKDIFGGFIDFLLGIFTGNLQRAIDGWRRMTRGIISIFAGLWNTVDLLFADFTDWVDHWTNGAVTKAVDGIKAAWNVLGGWFATLWANIRKPFDEFTKEMSGSFLGHLLGMQQPQLHNAQPGAPGAQGGLLHRSAMLSGHITVGVDHSGRLQVRTESHPSGMLQAMEEPSMGQFIGLA